MIGLLARDEFAEAVASGEDSFTEFKDPQVTNGGLAKEMCAFANAHGGRILIGVTDDGELRDAGDWDDEERVMNIARTAIDPPIVPSFQRLRWEDELTIAIVSVDIGGGKPHAVRSGESRRYYMRVGSTSREASRDELVRLTQASSAIAPDLRPARGSVPEDLDPTLVGRRFERLRTLDFDSLAEPDRHRILREAEILHPETGQPTIAGLLCYGRDPQQRLPYAAVECVAYPGEQVGRELADRSTAGGRLDEQIEKAVAFIERNMPARSTIEGVRRVEAARPSTESLREVVANAVAHRNYGIAGPTQVRVFEDRIEVANPGTPPNGVTPDGMRVGISVRRNQFLMSHLESLGVVDAVGRGITLLFEEAAERGLRPPVIVVEENVTTVTLFSRSG